MHYAYFKLVNSDSPEPTLVWARFGFMFHYYLSNHTCTLTVIVDELRNGDHHFSKFSGGETSFVVSGTFSRLGLSQHM